MRRERWVTINGQGIIITMFMFHWTMSVLLLWFSHLKFWSRQQRRVVAALHDHNFALVLIYFSHN